jgi:hypothetical protein
MNQPTNAHVSTSKLILDGPSQADRRQFIKAARFK